MAGCDRYSLANVTSEATLGKDSCTPCIADWLAGWLTHWLTDWLAGWLTHWLSGWLVDSLAGWLACSDSYSQPNDATDGALNEASGTPCIAGWLAAIGIV